MHQAVGEDAAADTHHGQAESHLEHPRCVRHHPVEVVADPDRPAEVPGDSAELVRKVRHDSHDDRHASPAQGGGRCRPGLLRAFATTTGDTGVAAPPVVGDRGRGPEQAADEQDDQVHPVPVQDVADAALLARYAGEREDDDRRGEREDRDQCVVRDHERQADREYGGDRLQHPTAGSPACHHDREDGATQAERGHDRRDHVHRRPFQDRAGRTIIGHLREGVGRSADRPVQSQGAVGQGPQ